MTLLISCFFIFLFLFLSTISFRFLTYPWYLPFLFWMLKHVYIPLLFFSGVDYIDAPTPYMMGLHSGVDTSDLSMDGVCYLLWCHLVALLLHSANLTYFCLFCSTIISWSDFTFSSWLFSGFLVDNSKFPTMFEWFTVI